MTSHLSPRTTDVELARLLGGIYERYHYDFRHYSVASIKRRIAAAQHDLGCESITALTERVLSDASAFTRLLSFLTVQVSEMFRDPSYFAVFRRDVVPELRTYPFVRIWVAGCSAGEEAYSLAIILKEEGLLDRSLIYATDINVAALEAAEAGVYPIERAQTYSANYQATGARYALSEHFTAGHDALMLDRSLRPHLVFSDHSLATDNVFAEVQVVSCRNVLIYFDRILQDRALGLFRDALCRRGFLGLGAKETVRFSGHADAFDEFRREDRWFRKR
jgi:chemotaxis protein methyltransferase CheR